MLAGHYGRWANGREEEGQTGAREDVEPSLPAHVSNTKYRIDVTSSDEVFAGWWDMRGGLVGRSMVPGGRLELFGRTNTRVHWPWYTAKIGRDYSEDYFLVLRSDVTGRGQLIKEWFFPFFALGLYVDPRIEDESRRTLPKEEAQRHIDQNKYHLVRAYVHFDPQSSIAKVTITGLTTPFEQLVDLSHELEVLKGR